MTRSGWDKSHPYERLEFSKIDRNLVKPLTKGGGMIYSIRQLHGRLRVSKVPGLKCTFGIRRCSGGVYPRLIFDFPSVIARHDSAEAIPGDCRALLAMTTKVRGPQ